MKLSHILTVAIRCASAVSSVAAVGLVARQFTIERTAVQVVASTAVVERMQGVSDAVEYLAATDQHSLLEKYGYSDRDAFDRALQDRRRELSEAQQVRADTLRANDKRLASLLAACAFAGIAALMGAIATYDIAATRKQRVAMSHIKAVRPPFFPTMNLIVVSFEDFTRDPAGARADSTPCAGFPDSWLDALVGTGEVFSRDYAAPGAVSTVGLHFPSSDHAEQFCLCVRKAASLLGTRAHIHKVPIEQAHSTLREVKGYDARFV